jgi:hypothetical protein
MSNEPNPNTPICNSMMKFCFGDDREYIRLQDAMELESELAKAKTEIERLNELLRVTFEAGRNEILNMENVITQLRHHLAKAQK